ncbi:MAG: hypothetical protein ACTSVB_11275 [Candidatus Heimdallarchaeaceae archaeon]
MYETKFLFVFDTSFFWSLLNVNRHQLIQDIKEVFDFVPNIEYLAPKIILKELSGKYKDKCPFLEQHIHFTGVKITEEEIKELKSLNYSLANHAFERDEKGDYLIIKSAQKHNDSEVVTFIVSNDEGIHLFLNQAIPEEKIKPIWVARFLSFLAKQSPTKPQKQRFIQASEMLEEYIETYRIKAKRGETPFYDIEKILMSAKFLPAEEQVVQLQEALENQIITGEKNQTLPSFINQIGSKLHQIFTYIDLGETNVIESQLESIENIIRNLNLEQQETIYRIISFYIIAILNRLASLYDQNGAFSGIVSALERAKYYLKYVDEYKDKSQLYAILSWIHLLNNSVDLSQYYFSKVTDKNFELARKLIALLTLYNTPLAKINLKLYELLPSEIWKDLSETLAICPNRLLRDKIYYIVNTFKIKPSFVFDARHFSLKNVSVSDNYLLSFLKEQFRILNIQKKESSVVIECYDSKIGQIELRLPVMTKLLKASHGDLISFQGGIVAKINKPGPGKKHSATIYFSKLEEKDYSVSKDSKLI